MDTAANISTMIIAFLSLLVSVILGLPRLLRFWRDRTASCRLCKLAPVLRGFADGNASREEVERVYNELDKLDIPHPYLTRTYALQVADHAMFWVCLLDAKGDLKHARTALREAKKLDEINDACRQEDFLREHGGGR